MKRSKITSALAILLCAVFLVSCAPSMIDYYADKDHYITATGVVDHIQLDEEGLYIGFSQMDHPFDDDTFKIVGENLKIVQQKGIDDKLQKGDTVTIITAPKYFGDGYVMPIVSICIDGEILLNFEQGQENLLIWLGE
ncbi:MAG: hypothetical protein IJZ37_06790 [Clostridia bacterium]|nr:hypothetical protein [Clostridia bacterium]